MFVSHRIHHVGARAEEEQNTIRPSIQICAHVLPMSESQFTAYVELSVQLSDPLQQSIRPELELNESSPRQGKSRTNGTSNKRTILPLVRHFYRLQNQKHHDGYTRTTHIAQPHLHYILLGIGDPSVSQPLSSHEFVQHLQHKLVLSYLTRYMRGDSIACIIQVILVALSAVAVMFRKQIDEMIELRPHQAQGVL